MLNTNSEIQTLKSLSSKLKIIKSMAVIEPYLLSVQQAYLNFNR